MGPIIHMANRNIVASITVFFILLLGVSGCRQSQAQANRAPTNTPGPTRTPRPTLTPTPLPEPLSVTGSGDAVINLTWPHGPALAVITGNRGGDHFAVKSLDANSEAIDLLVNTTDPYRGVRPINFTDEEVRRFEVTATGSWTIEVRPLAMAERLQVPGRVQGSGDQVLFLAGRTPDTAHIEGNSSGDHFAVHGWIPGDFTDLLVNVVEPYEGTVLLNSDTLVLQVTAAGAWSIEVTAR